MKIKPNLATETEWCTDVSPDVINSQQTGHTDQRPRLRLHSMKHNLSSMLISGFWEKLFLQEENWRVELLKVKCPWNFRQGVKQTWPGPADCMLVGSWDEMHTYHVSLGLASSKRSPSSDRFRMGSKAKHSMWYNSSVPSKAHPDLNFYCQHPFGSLWKLTLIHNYHVTSEQKTHHTLQAKLLNFKANASNFRGSSSPTYENFPHKPIAQAWKDTDWEMPQPTPILFSC